MKPQTWIIVALTWAAVGCKPDVGPPASLVQGPVILAIKANPAEAKPGESVNYEALVVDLSGRLAVANSEIANPVLWSVCDQPKPPIENNSVAVGCLDTGALPGLPGPTPSTFAAPIPFDACSVFGPTQPPGDPPIRGRDPDVTGGYYVPIRASLVVPEAQRRAGMATADSLTAFAHERVFCGIADVPNEIALRYMRDYVNNANPELLGLKMMGPGEEDYVAVPPVGSGSVPLQLKAGQVVRFVADWTPESVETYPAWDVLAKDLIYHSEGFRLAWFATGGEFEYVITGRTETEPELFTQNNWTTSSVGLFHIWIVLHDSRGGIDFQSYDIEVIP